MRLIAGAVGLNHTQATGRLSSNPMELTPAEIDALPLEEKLELVEALWDSIYSSDDGSAVPEWDKKLLDERLKEPNPEFDTWENVRNRFEHF